ncbi:Ig-like domain-containing protein [bacterium]
MKRVIPGRKFSFAVLGGILCLVFVLVTEGFSQGNNKPKVIVVPSEATVELDSSFQFSAHLEYKDGTIENTTFEWSVSGKAVGTITSIGVFTAIAPGNGHVVAKAGKYKGRARVTVIGDKPDGRKRLRVVIVPHDTVLVEGETCQYTAYLEDSNGPINPDTEFFWGVDDPAVASIDSSGFLTALAKGNTFIHARGGGFSGKAHLNVERDGTLTIYGGKNKVWITPRDTTLSAGEEVQFLAVFVDSRGSKVDTAFTWTLDEGGFGTIDSTGLFTAVRKGHGFVHASVGLISGKAHVTVEGNHWRVMVVPRDTAIVMGDSLQMTAFLQDTAGVTQEASFTWSVSDPEVASIDSTGMFKGLIKGNTFVYASTDYMMGKAHVVVHDSLWVPDDDSGFELEILPADTSVAVGDTVVFTAYLVDSLGVWTEVDAEWRTPGRIVGAFDSATVFIAAYAGVGNIQAKTPECAGLVKLTVVPVEPFQQASPEQDLALQIPDQYRVYDNYPNPFNPETTIRYDLPEACQVSIRIFDQLGRQVRVLTDTHKDAGSYHVVWDSKDGYGNSVPTGIYFMRIVAGEYTATRKMLLMK